MCYGLDILSLFLEYNQIYLPDSHGCVTLQMGPNVEWVGCGHVISQPKAIPIYLGRFISVADKSVN